MSKANQHDPLLVIKILEKFREWSHRDGEYGLKQIDGWFRGSYGDKQLRTALEHLVEGGYLERSKDSSRYNRNYYRLVSIEQDEEVDERSIYRFIIGDLVETISRFMDERGHETPISIDSAQNNDRLRHFLAVAGDDDMLFFDDEQFRLLKNLFKNYRQQSFTRVWIGKEETIDRLYVFQVRLDSEGFKLMGLEPKAPRGAKLHYIPLNDIIKIKQGERFTISEKQMSFIQQELVQLSGRELTLLSGAPKRESRDFADNTP